jgi:SAM-dependent methyltransferase
VAHDWTEDYFDEDYLWLYAGALPPERTAVETAGLWALAGLREGARVLDIACGPGRISVPLARRGARVTGVDRSAPLLARARAQAAQVEVTLALARADMRALPFRARFDAATLVYSSLGYGTDDDSLAALRAARTALVPGGRLVLDLVHRDRYARDAGIEREWYRIAGPDGTPGRDVLCERVFDPVAGEERAHLRWQGGEKRFRLRLYTATELVAMARTAGFGGPRLYGGYGGEPFHYTSPMLVAVLRA